MIGLDTIDGFLQGLAQLVWLVVQILLEDFCIDDRFRISREAIQLGFKNSTNNSAVTIMNTRLIVSSAA